MQPLLEQLNILHNNPPKLDEKDKYNYWKRAEKEVEEQIKIINIAKYNEIIDMKTIVKTSIKKRVAPHSII